MMSTKEVAKKATFLLLEKLTQDHDLTLEKKKKAVLLAVYSYASKQIDGSQILILVSFFFICFYTIWYAGWSLGQYLSQEVHMQHNRISMCFGPLKLFVRNTNY